MIIETNSELGNLILENFVMDNGAKCEIFLPENNKDRIEYSNEHCRFKPVGYIRTDFGWMPLAFKVVTTNLESLGLRNNPTPMKFPIGKWVFEDKPLVYGKEDSGGIWTAHRRGSINTLKKHCKETWNMETRGFLAAVYNPVAFVGNYRIKSEGVMLIKEIL